MTAHILIVEDDRVTRMRLAGYLRSLGYRITEVEDAEDMQAVIDTDPPEILLLDIGLEGKDGLTITREQRAQSRVGIILLTSRDEQVDRIVGLEMGADDYVTKPFSSRELLARINAVIRRARMLPPNLQVSEASRWIRFGDWRLDTTARHLLDADGTVYALSGAEYRLLRVFLDHPQRVLSRDQLLNLTQGREAELFDRSIDLLVSRLRQRLRDDAREPAHIKTVRSEGYVLAMPVEIVAART